MNKLYKALALGALIVLVAGSAYLLGWYRGVNYHAVKSGMSEAQWSLSAARSLRDRNPALALEILEANISWVDASLKLEPLDVPDSDRANFDRVLSRLADYREKYGVRDRGSD